MLTADAFGILPPIARLTRDQALYYFLSGFTAKLAGTEIGVTEPQPTFSTCFGAPFLPQPPAVYARMLGEKLDAHGAAVWLVNTGLDGRPVRRRAPDADPGDPGACSHAALSGELDDGRRTAPTTVFGFDVPIAVPGVDASLLDPRSTWRDPEAYDAKARELAVACSGRTSRRVRRRCGCSRRGSRTSRVERRGSLASPCRDLRPPQRPR